MSAMSEGREKWGRCSSTPVNHSSLCLSWSRPWCLCSGENRDQSSSNEYRKSFLLAPYFMDPWLLRKKKKTKQNHGPVVSLSSSLGDARCIVQKILVLLFVFPLSTKNCFFSLMKERGLLTPSGYTIPIPQFISNGLTLNCLCS